jgi:von Hippel-Lindau disease tumor suppressor protein
MPDQNFVTAQWGVLSVFGVAVVLLIAQADQKLRAFRGSARDDARRAAEAWARRTKGLALGVLVAVAALSLAGVWDLGVTRVRPLGWVLLAAPVLVQSAFIVLVVFALVLRVPPLVILRLEPADALGPSPPEEAPETAMRVLNQTPDVVVVEWIGFDGRLRSYGDIAPGTAKSYSTFAGHRWRFSRPSGAARTVTVQADPSKVLLRSGDMEPRPDRARTGSTAPAGSA